MHHAILHLVRTVGIVVLLAFTQAQAHAAILLERLPAVQPYGIQADASTGWLSQAVEVGSGGVERVVWWGFHGANSLGAGADAFEVYLDGVVVSGSLNASPVGDLTRYTLQLSQAVAGPAELAIWNASGDVEWFWQSVAVGNDSQAAFTLEGTLSVVPEPATGMLLAAGLALLGVRRTWRVRRGKRMPTIASN